VLRAFDDALRAVEGGCEMVIDDSSITGPGVYCDRHHSGTASDLGVRRQHAAERRRQQLTRTRNRPHRFVRTHFSCYTVRLLYAGPDLGGVRGPRAPGLPPRGGLPPNPSRGRERKGRMGGIAPSFLKSQIRHWAPGLPPAKSGPDCTSTFVVSGVARNVNVGARLSSPFFPLFPSFSFSFP